jgi:uncharacterized small protein (DUF1192 family)
MLHVHALDLASPSLPVLGQINSEVGPIMLASHASATRHRAPRRVGDLQFGIPTSPSPVSTSTLIIAMSVTEIEQRCNVLRSDLKVWEKKFAAENNGRKAGRDDIKANEDICMHATRNFLTSIAYIVQQISTKSTANYAPNRSPNPHRKHPRNELQAVLMPANLKEHQKDRQRPCS